MVIYGYLLFALHRCRRDQFTFRFGSFSEWFLAEEQNQSIRGPPWIENYRARASIASWRHSDRLWPMRRRMLIVLWWYFCNACCLAAAQYVDQSREKFNESICEHAMANLIILLLSPLYILRFISIFVFVMASHTFGRTRMGSHSHSVNTAADVNFCERTETIIINFNSTDAKNRVLYAWNSYVQCRDEYK